MKGITLNALLKTFSDNENLVIAWGIEYEYGTAYELKEYLKESETFKKSMIVTGIYFSITYNAIWIELE